MNDEKIRKAWILQSHQFNLEEYAQIEVWMTCLFLDATAESLQYVVDLIAVGIAQKTCQ